MGRFDAFWLRGKKSRHGINNATKSLTFQMSSANEELFRSLSAQHKMEFSAFIENALNFYALGLIKTGDSTSIDVHRLKDHDFIVGKIFELFNEVTK